MGMLMSGAVGSVTCFHAGAASAQVPCNEVKQSRPAAFHTETGLTFSLYELMVFGILLK